MNLGANRRRDAGRRGSPTGGKRHYSGTRTQPQDPKRNVDLRPSADQLSAWVRQYVSSIDECERRRNGFKTEFHRYDRRRKAEAQARGKSRWDLREREFRRQLVLARLSRIWDFYIAEHGGADHTHELAFLGWAHTSGRYIHGLEALNHDWQNAKAGLPATMRRSEATESAPHFRHPGQRASTQTSKPSGGADRGRPSTRNQPDKTSTGNPTNNDPKADASISTPVGPKTQQPPIPDGSKAPLIVRNWIVVGMLACAMAIVAVATIFAA